jgi:hypothetical protein
MGHRASDIAASGAPAGRLVPLQEAERARTRIFTTIRYGQLGWLALAWSAATLHEAWEFMEKKGHVFDWVAVLLGCEIVVVLTAMLSRLGARLAPDARRGPQRSVTAADYQPTTRITLLH